MAFPFPSLAGLLARRALLAYAATWAAVAVTAVAVAVAAFAPELAFVWAVGPGTPLSRACQGDDGFSVGLPLDGPPWDVGRVWFGRHTCGAKCAARCGAVGAEPNTPVVCVPAGMFGQAGPDVVVPLVFAVVVVTGAVWFTTAVGVWEDDHDASLQHV